MKGRHRLRPGVRSGVRQTGRRLDSLYIAYWELADPLTRSQVVPVVEALAKAGYGCGLVTYERWGGGREGGQGWHAKVEQAEEVAARLAGLDIPVSWHPLRYHSRPKVVSTLWDAVSGVVLASWLGRKGGPRLLHSRGTVPAAPAFAAARLFGARFLYDADGPLSEEYADAGVWGRGSLPHRLTARSESEFFKGADATVVLTEARRSQVVAGLRGVGGLVTVIPCGVDTDVFRPDRQARARLRAELGLAPDDVVLVYAGKHGGWYGIEEMMGFVSAVRLRSRRGVRLLVLTPDRPRLFERAARASGVSDILSVRSACHDEMPGYLSSADVGLSFVRPFPSKAASSPVKNGEYLACGLPVVTPGNIGDYSDLIRREEVGVVIDRLEPAAYRAAASALLDLLEDVSGLKERCRQVAVAEVDMKKVVIPRYLEIYEELIGPPRAD
jgi:glycosyltransferase involved in cell wall biosynthesis